MKRFSILLLLMAGSLFYTAVYAQGPEIPEKVVNHFKSKYPSAQKIDWDKESNGYEVEFRLNGVKWEAYYDVNSNWIKTERDVRRGDVPQAVWNALAKSEYADWKVDDIEEHQTPEHEKLYEIEVKGNGRKAYLYFLPDGRMLQ